jgi:hypothetical protein
MLCCQLGMQFHCKTHTSCIKAAPPALGCQYSCSAKLRIIQIEFQKRKRNFWAAQRWATQRTSEYLCWTGSTAVIPRVSCPVTYFRFCDIAPTPWSPPTGRRFVSCDLSLPARGIVDETRRRAAAGQSADRSAHSRELRQCWEDPFWLNARKLARLRLVYFHPDFSDETGKEFDDARRAKNCK